MPIDTHLDVTPSDITASATAIGNVTSHVDSTEDDLISARKSVCELEGSSAMAASGSISTSVADCESLVSNLGSYKTALDNLASALSSVKTDLQGIRDQATAGGLLLNGETVYDPATVMAAPADGGGGAGGVTVMRWRRPPCTRIWGPGSAIFASGRPRPARRSRTPAMR